MEHFAIIQALCRVAMSSPSDAIRRQVERLAEALKEDGEAKQAKGLSALLTASEKRQEMAPSRIRASKAMLVGEELTRNTALPVDRETSVPLVQVLFPDELPSGAPYFEGHIREAVTSLMEEWQNFDRLEEASIAPARTCLIFGPPGTGKTHLALWLAGSLGLPVVVARLDGLVSSFLGTTSRNIGALFAFAGRYRCLLLLDEFDAIAKLRNDPQEVGEIKRVVNTLLQNLDSRSNNGFTIGITNHDGLLDPAVWRRFEIQLQVPNPGHEARAQIIQRYLHPLSLPESHVKLLAWITDGASGAELESLVRLIKKNHVLRPVGKNFLEDLRLIALMSSGRITHMNRDLLFGDIKELLGILMNDVNLNFTQVELGQVLNRDKSTVSRMLASTPQDGMSPEVSHG